MALRDWFRPPRQLMLVFLAVALVSTGALGWLTWHLLAEDRAAEQQRRWDDVEHVADAATATMQRDVAALGHYLDVPWPSNEPLPAGVMAVSMGPAGVAARPAGSLLYVPIALATPAPVSDALTAAEHLEIASDDRDGAARAYAAIVPTDHLALRAAALVGLAGVERKRRHEAAALDAYRRLDELPAVGVDGLSAALIARVGRASIFEETHDPARLHDEALALAADLDAGRLPVTESQYRYYRSEAARWLGAGVPPDDADAVTRAKAVAWLWQNRAEGEGRAQRLIVFPSGTALVTWQPRDGTNGLLAVIAGPTALAHLVAAAVPAGMKWTLVDFEGRLAAGDAPPARTVTRTSAATTLPWTFHLFPSADAGGALVSPQRTRLIAILATVAGVLMAGWFFVWRGMTREIRAARLQSDFVAAVSHEFRSPLTSLRHIGDLLAGDRLPSEERRRRSYALLVGETDRLSRLVEGLLDFGRFQAGTPALRLRPTDVTEIVVTVMREYRDQLASPQHAFEVTMAATRTFVMGDRDALARALWNLVDNAVKYSPNGGLVRVTLDDGGDPGSVSLSVRDEGIGIPGPEQRRVFDRFVRGAEATSRRIRGTGIGLAMVREIAEAHGGRVGVESESGAGSTFAITLPTVDGVPASADVRTRREGDACPES